MTPPLLTRALALRLEDVVGAVHGRVHPDDDPALRTVARFGRAVACRAGTGRPVNSVFGFGDADRGRLDALLAFYAAGARSPTFHLAPADFSGALATALGAAGFAPREFRRAVLYGRPTPTPAPLPPGVTVEEVGADDADAFARLMDAAYAWPDAWREAAMDEARRAFRPGHHHYVVRHEGRAVGTGSLVVHEDAVWLRGGAVLAEARGRGCHAALVSHRLHVAHRLGGALALGGADFGSASFRNQQRGGLRLAYVESEWTRA